MLIHNGFTFYGTHGDLEWGRWENPLQRSKVAGLAGVNVLSLKRGSREFSTDIWIHNNFASVTLLMNYLGLIEARANAEGTLVRSGTIARSIPNVRFDSLDLDREAIPSANLGWFAIARLNFEQLRP